MRTRPAETTHVPYHHCLLPCPVPIPPWRQMDELRQLEEHALSEDEHYACAPHDKELRQERWGRRRMGARRQHARRCSHRGHQDHHHQQQQEQVCCTGADKACGEAGRVEGRGSRAAGRRGAQVRSGALRRRQARLDALWGLSDC